MKRAWFLLVFCFATDAASQPLPSSESCLDRGARRCVDQLLTRIYDLERQLDASLEGCLRDRAKAAEVPPTSELQSRVDAANREMERLHASNQECSDSLLEARKTTRGHSSAGSSTARERDAPGGPPPTAAVTERAVSAEAPRTGKTIVPGSLVAIRAENVEEMNVQVRVSRDGTIELPLIGRLQAAGRAEDELGADIERKLSEYVVKPRVDVTLR